MPTKYHFTFMKTMHGPSLQLQIPEKHQTKSSSRPLFHTSRHLQLQEKIHLQGMFAGTIFVKFRRLKPAALQTASLYSKLATAETVFARLVKQHQAARLTA